MVVTILLLGLMALATATDFARHKIYNWTTYPGILVALGFHGFGSLLLASGVFTASQLQPWGWMPFAESLIGFFACGFLMLACFVFFRIGGGDVKLMAMLGAFLGFEEGIMALLWTFVLGGCVGVIVLICRVGAGRLIVRVLRQLLWTLRLGRWSPLSEEERAQLQTPLFLAPSALAAVVIVRLGLVNFLL